MPRKFQYLVQDRIRGKMAEVIFEEMFKQAGYIVMFQGYERNFEFLVQARGVFRCDPKVVTLGRTPDFLIIGAKNYYFVEVKYRTTCNLTAQKRLAEELAQYYPHARLFLVHPYPPYFYYNSVERMIEQQGKMDPLRPREVGISDDVFGDAVGAFRTFVKTS